jgi:hypothetical protein
VVQYPLSRKEHKKEERTFKGKQQRSIINEITKEGKEGKEERAKTAGRQDGRTAGRKGGRTEG